jgi:hypothetical protein
MADGQWAMRVGWGGLEARAIDDEALKRRDDKGHSEDRR